MLYVQDDFFLLSEMVHDYIGIVGAVKDVLAERIKAWQAWQGVQVPYLLYTTGREDQGLAGLAGGPGIPTVQYNTTGWTSGQLL